MVDARSILDAIIAGSSEQTRSAREGGGLGDIMGDLLGQLQKGGGQASQFDRGDEGGGQARSRNPLEDLFGQLGGGGSSYQQPEHSQNRSAPQGEAGYGDMFERVKDLVGNNKATAGAVAAGLGGLLLGTKSGRSIAGRAARLGGVALIGTLAYKAFKNFQAGAAAPTEGQSYSEELEMPELPPTGSGFEEAAMTNNDAELFIKTMVSAAAADGQIDRTEQQKILGNLEQAGLAGDAMEFLAQEFNNPANIEDIIDSVKGEEQAAKVYAAARIAIEPDTREEQQYLSYLAQELRLPRELAAHIDATASGIKVR